MREKTRFRPSVNHLEDRSTPATVRLIGATAYVSNLVGPLTITGTDLNQIQIQDATTKVTVNAPGGLFVTGSEGSNVVSYDVANKAYQGNVFINTLGGADTVSIVNSGATPTTIGGDITVLTGTGTDSVAFSGNVGALSVGGNTTVVDGGGIDVIRFSATGNTNFLGDFSAVGFNDVNIGQGANSAVFLGSTSFVNGSDNAAVGFGVINNSKFAGPLSITTGTANDTVQLNNADIAAGVPAFASRVDINLGSGNNTFATNAATAQTIAGPLSYTGYAGADSISLASSLTALSNATFNLGDGTNTLDPAGVTKSFNVDGTLTINAGSGTDTINNFAANVGGDLRLNLGDGTNSISFNNVATIGGNFAYNAGNGANTVDFTGAGLPVLNNVDFTVGNGPGTLILSDAQSIGGNLNVRLGNGGDSISLLGSVNGRFDFNGGNGNDTVVLGNTLADTYFVNLVYGNGNDSVAIAGFVSGNILGGTGNNTGTQTVASLVSPVTISNFILTVV